MTTRADVEGTLARWFAVDADECIGVFSGAYAAWPALVFDDYAVVSAGDDLLGDATPFTNPVASADFAAQCKLSTEPIDFSASFALRDAACGLFSFDADLGYG